ncbi:NAD(P)-binding protein [Trichoderma citrinoviride]|uniref:NAD(P)-binding protein n=1 Tax=Trichoderma citrinoviride TaxID=58853 RepID=A0A2T4BLK6_9HYPO|nr:NAD(P)-binding protein [Trichoderma citrinoviride]PTB70202.1 NAD(P)-binding protein [Trichoderma citrinoviride]
MSLTVAPQTKTIHNAAYPAISASRPELSQKGRVVYVTGGSAGIGLAICHAFADAQAATVILTGRREAALSEAVDALSKEHPKTKFIGQVLDAADRPATEMAWAQLEKDGILVDVLVLNAAFVTYRQASLVELPYDEGWPSWVTNVGANYDLIQRFYHQKNRSLVNLSTMAIHAFEQVRMFPAYCASKNAGTLLVQLFAQDVSPDDMQVLSFHPGAIWTDGVKKSGVPKEAFAWDDETLASNYAVWAASDEAKFLHGRFTWAAWDVEELQSEEFKKRLEEKPTYLQVGVVGLS